MSCRTTHAGSLATTFIARAYGLEDGQATSLFHELRRIHRDAGPAAVQITERQYNAAVSHMGTMISTLDCYTEHAGMQERALRRFANTLREGLPSDPEIAFATYGIVEAANGVKTRLDNVCRAIANTHNVTPEAVQGEFKRLYKSYDELHRSDPTVAAHWVTLSPDPELTKDAATQFAQAAIRFSNRCGLCGQFTAGTGAETTRTHTCPPSGERPMMQTVVPARVVAPVARWTCYDCGWTYDADQREGHSCSECWDCGSYVPDDASHDCSSDDDDYDDDRTPPRPVERVSSPIGDETRSDVVPPVYVRDVVEPVDIESFQSMYDAARARIANGDSTVPAFENPLPGQVTGGLGARVGGNSFGIELEIDFPNEDYPYNAREIFARRLYEEGIVSAPFVQRWHHLGDDRPGGTFTETPDGWICEFDRSVDDVDGERGVEIKSQILYDEPRTWHNIKRITEIARELGGAPTMRTGLHVNVGGANFSSTDPTAHNALLRLAAAYDDTLVRLAHNPQSGPRHRGRAYCGFAGIPADGYQEVSSARAYSNHYQAFNLGHLPAAGERHRNSSRVEVRVWDSTLDHGRIQAAVTASLAMIHLGLGDVAPGQGPERAGAHRARFGRSKLSGAEWEQSTESFRRFLTLLDKAGAGTESHRNAFTTMFAASRWQER